MSKRYRSPLSDLSRADYDALPQETKDHATMDARKWKAERTMKLVDSWPKELRELAHEIGHPLVEAFLNAGLRDARRVRHLVALCRGQTIDGRPAAFGNIRNRSSYAALTRHHAAKADRSDATKSKRDHIARTQS